MKTRKVFAGFRELFLVGFSGNAFYSLNFTVELIIIAISATGFVVRKNHCGDADNQ